VDSTSCTSGPTTTILILIQREIKELLAFETRLSVLRAARPSLMFTIITVITTALAGLLGALTQTKTASGNMKATGWLVLGLTFLAVIAQLSIFGESRNDKKIDEASHSVSATETSAAFNSLELQNRELRQILERQSKVLDQLKRGAEKPRP
jgi:hypothetical protein